MRRVTFAAARVCRRVMVVLAGVLPGSWILTGENRPYLRTTAHAGAILPKRRLGAVEVVTRYSHLNLTDGPIDGGLMDKWHPGVNWWASAQWKIGLS
jgi:phosphate-selective porin OprO and OprP